ncbi:recombination protein NinB [Segnochrobactraceae bacterium EtOH-i3]
MSRAVLVLASDAIRQKARGWILSAPRLTRVEFRAPRRTLPQNARMWAMLTDIAIQLPWHGLKLSAEDWKLILLDALGREVRLAPNIEGTGLVNLGRSTSELTVQEMSDLMELIAAFGARHGVVFQEGCR